MAKLCKALVGFDYPADANELEKALRGQPHKRARAEKGDELEPYNDDILASWLANGAVREVK